MPRSLPILLKPRPLYLPFLQHRNYSPPLKQVYPSYLCIYDHPSTWTQIGFTIPSHHSILLNELTIHLQSPEDKTRGVGGWNFANIDPSIPSVDGIPIVKPHHNIYNTQMSSHNNGAYEVDHIVIKSNNWRNTELEFAKLGIQCRRKVINKEKNMVYMFYRPSRTIIEVLAPEEAESNNIDQPSSIIGLTFSCRDIDATHAYLKDCTKAPWEAIQPGRRITTVIKDRRDISIRVAFMSPHVKTTDHKIQPT
mmetsp:Transcript_18613/g.26969  ORF Transcript_18613/g.26969 Transcript_18613/m.26969 type:complete len:251 (-) Transcript_18613:770-1522(-)